MHNKSKIYGIIKFFSSENYLNDFINGKVYCNTPSFYRSSLLPGIGDKRESCMVSYYNDSNLELKINGHTIDASQSKIIISNNGQTDAWLHCWYTFSIPTESKNSAENFIENLKSEMATMRKEFGSNNFVFIKYLNIKKFIKRIQENTKYPVSSNFINYVDDLGRISLFAKYSSFKYQKEYRIVIGECELFEMEPLIIDVKGGFLDLLMVNPEIKLSHPDLKDHLI